eukprot:s2497_g3.t1
MNLMTFEVDARTYLQVANANAPAQEAPVQLDDCMQWFELPTNIASCCLCSLLVQDGAFWSRATDGLASAFSTNAPETSGGQSTGLMLRASCCPRRWQWPQASNASLANQVPVKCDSDNVVVGASFASAETFLEQDGSVRSDDSHASQPQFVVEASTSSKPEAVFGTLAAAVALTGLAARARPGKGHRIVLLRAEGETEAKAESPDSKAEDTTGDEEEEMADAEDEGDEEDEDDDEDEEGEANKPSKWKCLECGHVNFAAATECDKCGALKPSPEEAKVVEERDQAKAEVAKVMDGFLRMQADLQNYRRQHDEAMGRAKDLGKLDGVDALRKLLPFNEDIEAAIAEPDGMDAKDKARTTATVGEKFDSIEHVEEREASDGQETGTILEVVNLACDCKTLKSKICWRRNPLPHGILAQILPCVWGMLTCTANQRW